MAKPRAKQLGVTDADYQQRLEAQGGGCAICGAKPKSRRLHVDHDHKTGAIRGLLCYRCNRVLPNYVTEEWLLNAVRYLRNDGDSWPTLPGDLLDDDLIVIGPF